ncbi:MAG: NAD-dependent epimerase/dehydratase family protein [Actinomycetota bacterium]
MAKVLITGGAGFIGSNTAHSLQRLGHEVYALDDLSLGCSGNLPPGTPLIVGDVAEAGLWRNVPEVDAVVHLAGASSAPMFPDNLAACFQNNVVGWIRVLDYARACGARRVAFASTSSVYGNVDPPLREDGPLELPNFYAVSKYCMEQIGQMYHQQYGLEVVGLRFMSVYGPREDHKGHFANLVSQFIWAVEDGQAPVVYGDGEQSRDFTNVRDIAQAIRRVIEHPTPLGSTVFNVGTAEPTTVNELLAILSELMERPVRPQHIPNPVHTGYVRQQICNIDRIRRALGFQPSVSLREGISEILQVRRELRSGTQAVAVGR